MHPGGIDISDSLGWEWAGVFGHSTPGHTEFFGIENEGVFNNGFFSFGTLAPFWGTNYRYSTGGYNNLGYYWYQDNDTIQNPYYYSLHYKGKVARWLWKVSSSKSYNMYVYYQPDQNNNSNVSAYLYNTAVNSDGTPGAQYQIKYANPNPPPDSLYWGLNRVPIVINFQQHETRQPGLPSDTNWRCVDNLNLTAGTMALLFMTTNSDNSGNYIADAIRFISTDGAVDTILVNNGPTSYPDNNNQPYGILSTNGFFTNDEINRGYEDMGDEPGGSGFSKTQFFLTKACWINNFITTKVSVDEDPKGNGIIKNLGNLYALGHNGLICFGTANSDFPGEDKSHFTAALKNGKDFGEAFLAQQNASWNSPFYSLLGAGNLRAQPYIQFGSDLEQNESITTTVSISKNQPVLMQGVTVNGSGNLTVTSTNNLIMQRKNGHKVKRIYS